MGNNRKRGRKSAFEKHGFKETIHFLLKEIQDLYLSDRIPWIVGYSGGKDSAATLQLLWLSLLALEPEKRVNPVHVISTDTLVENPVVSTWVMQCHKSISEAANREALPIYTHRLTPQISDSFWVNLIGLGYPAPRPRFRWCTDRLKINPSNRFITNVVRKHEEAILVLGMRKAESSKRGHGMKKLEDKRFRGRLSPNTRLPNCYVFTPIEEWTNEDVWLFLLQKRYTPWGFDNEELFRIYKGASADNECPLVVDTGTPSCGASRFGCWVCTLVDKDRSMQAMIQNDEEKKWMLPLLRLRDEELAVRPDRHMRDFRRMSGAVQIYNGRPIPGPYKQEVRERLLERLLGVQQLVRKNGPSHMADIKLITKEELHEIRRIWVVEKHELEDSLPRIYKKVTGELFSDQKIDDNLVFGADEIELLREICGKNQLHFQLTRELLAVEQRYRMMARRSGLYGALEEALRRSFYENEEDAAGRALSLRDAMKAAKEGIQPSLPGISVDMLE